MEKMNPKEDFTQNLWKNVLGIYTDLIQHPFVTQLAEGTLPHHCFAHYLSQDILYIRDDSKALKKLSEKAPTKYEKDFFKSLATDGIAIEEELHTYFLKYFKVAETKTKSSIIDKYTHFLMTHAEKSSYNIAAAALLPCFWIYNKVGKHIVSKSTKNNTYQKWIDTYQSDEFDTYTTAFIQIIDRLADKASENEKKLMGEAFIESTNYELRFFEESILTTPIF
jgi:thiaminase/transcriptional activator TenA